MANQDDNLRWFGSFYSMRPSSNEFMAQVSGSMQTYMDADYVKEYMLTTAEIVMASRSLWDDNIFLEDNSVNVLEMMYRTDAFEDMLSITPDEVVPIHLYSTMDIPEAASIYGTIPTDDRDWKERAKEKKDDSEGLGNSEF